MHYRDCLQFCRGWIVVGRTGWPILISITCHPIFSAEATDGLGRSRRSGIKDDMAAIPSKDQLFEICQRAIKTTAGDRLSAKSPQFQAAAAAR
jgi:hypothetical protein